MEVRLVHNLLILVSSAILSTTDPAQVLHISIHISISISILSTTDPAQV